MAIEFNDNIHVKINRPTDFRYGPFESTAQALSLIPIAQRYHGLSFGVYTTPLDLTTSDIDCYYFYNDLTVFKPCGNESSGHIIVDDNDNELLQQPKLKFERLIVTDDDTNEQTIVARPSDTSIELMRPSSPLEGDEWTDPETFKTYKYYDGYWVELPSSGSGGSGESVYTASTGLEMILNDVRLGVPFNANSGRQVNFTNFGTQGWLNFFSSNTNAANITVGSNFFQYTGTSDETIDVESSFLLETSSVNDTSGTNTVISVDGRAKYDDGFYWIKTRTNQADGLLQMDTSTSGGTDFAQLSLLARNYQTTNKFQGLNLYSYEDATFIDNVTLRGLKYDGDYEANFLPRSLVTKQYVDGLVGGGFSVAGRGLSSSGNIVNLGDLISGSDYEIKMSDFVSSGSGSLYLTRSSGLFYSFLGMNVSPTNNSVGLHTSYNLSASGVDLNSYSSGSSSLNLYVEDYDNGTNSAIYLSVNDGPQSIVVYDSISHTGLTEFADYSANKTNYSYITPAWLRFQSGYNPSVAQYFTHNSSGNFIWINI
jgi:hypothetical protein